MRTGTGTGPHVGLAALAAGLRPWAHRLLRRWALVQF